MDPQDLKHKLEGVFCFPATPFNPDHSLDIDGLRQNIAWLKTTGVSMIAPACVAGEFYSLTMDEFMAIVEAVVEEVNGEVPVVVGTGHGAGMAAEFSLAAQEMGADGLLVLPPYLPEFEQEGLGLYVAQIASAVDLGIVLYNRDSAIYSEETAERLIQLENVIGFMDGSGSLDHFTMLRRHIGDHLVWLNGNRTAEMTAPSYFAEGAAGYSSAIANFLPEVSLDFYRAYRSDDMDKVWDITDRLVKPICDIRDRRKGYGIAYIKAGLDLIRRAGGPVRPPLTNLDDQSREDLRRILSFWTDLPED